MMRDVLRADEGHHREVNHTLGSMRPNPFGHVNCITCDFCTHKHTDSHFVHIESGRQYYWFHTPRSRHTCEMILILSTCILRAVSYGANYRTSCVPALVAQSVQ